MKFKKMIIAFIILLLIVLILFIPSRTALVFYQENTKEIAAFLPMNKGDQFDIIFTHSIHLTDVEEKYIITADLNIEQYEMIFESFGIGMPSNAEEGQKFEAKDGKYHIGNMNIRFESMNIRNGKTVSEHRLRWQYAGDDEEQMVWFNDYFEPGARYTVKIDKLPLWKYLKGVKIDE
ncbi:MULTISPECIES: DUF1850 domain-containing protein [unclassified Oceanobacillus]|uniref:DUF1850 domain-containing protein n=1 Tax=unclassified Oceanobacillus TaxID=2630292 RepID=UPI00300DEC1F